MNEEQLEANVRRGAAWIDKYKPDWWKELDLDTLDMGSCSACVLGQSFMEKGYQWAKNEGYTDEEMAANPIMMNDDFSGFNYITERIKSDIWATQHGFDANTRQDNIADQYHYLDKLWESEVQERRINE